MRRGSSLAPFVDYLQSAACIQTAEEGIDEELHLL